MNDMPAPVLFSPSKCGIVPEVVGRDRLSRANRCIEELHRVGGAVILAHPFWTGLDWGSIRTLRGVDAVGSI